MQKKRTNNVRLPEYITPIEYHLTLQPDLATFTFSGEETITLDLEKSVKELTIHTDEIEISSAEYDEQKGSISYNKSAETATIKFLKPLPKGKGALSLVFTGILNDKMRGFYRSKYIIEGKEQHIAVTQFEATDARRAFPCFDEPAKKAVFHVTLIVPEDHTAISNTIEKEVAEHKEGYKIVRFEPTPVMSTYLVAFIVGKFEYIEKKSQDGVLVRVFVTPGKKRQAEFALETAVKTISFFSNYFKIPYPLPVMDLIAIPDFGHGAMENWGAVTYRETALLVDPEHTATANKQWVALVIAHEFAHQWFGNLVTMEWWTHLWLNEGFASYIEYLAVDHIFPDWDIWSQFVYLDHSRALELDGLQSTHPIEVEVYHPSEISEIFDAVSYSKGASIIRMLAEYLGQENFRNGLQKYLRKHSYKNTETKDLWEALEEVAKKPVQKIMSDWTKKAGYPLVTVEEEKSEINVSQTRFLSSVISQKKSKDTTKWAIPITIKSSSSKKDKIILLKDKKMKLPIKQSDKWMKLNSGETSMIRVQYSDKNLESLKTAIEKKEISQQDRFGIIRDIFVLSEGGRSSTDKALALCRSFINDDSYIVWAEIATQLAKLSNVLAEEQIYPEFEIYARSIFSTIGERTGWDKEPNEKHTEAFLF